MEALRIICVEGNIGAGKSSVLQELLKRGYTVVPEPVETWSHIFPLFVKNPHRYAFVFQTQVAASLIQQYQTAISAYEWGPKDNVVFVERSFTSAGAFVQVAADNGFMSTAEETTYHNLAASIGWTPSQYIFIATPLKTCLERIQKRGRQEETGLTLGDLHKIGNAFCALGITSNAVNGSVTPAEIADKIIASVAQKNDNGP